MSVSYLHVDVLQVWMKLCPFSFQKDLLYANETENCGLGLVKSMVSFSEIRIFGREKLSLNMTSWRYTCSCYLQAVWEKLRTLEAVAQCGCRNNDGLTYMGYRENALIMDVMSSICFIQSRYLVNWLYLYTGSLFFKSKSIKVFFLKQMENFLRFILFSSSEDQLKCFNIIQFLFLPNNPS